MQATIIFFTALVATTLSSMSGGGASVITIPILLWLGIPFPLATLAQKTSSTFWVLPSAYNYLHDRKVNWKFAIAFSLLGLVGVYFGTLLVINVNQHIFQKIIGFVILSLVIYVLFSKKLGLSENKIYSKLRMAFAYPFALILGFYESIFGSGNGILLAIVTLYTRGFDFIDALGYYYIVAFPWVAFASILLFIKGYWSTAVIVPMVLGSLIGGYVGSKYAKYKGNKFIKIMFAIVGAFLAVKLISGV